MAKNRSFDLEKQPKKVENDLENLEFVKINKLADTLLILDKLNWEPHISGLPKKLGSAVG